MVNGDYWIYSEGRGQTILAPCEGNASKVVESDLQPFNVSITRKKFDYRMKIRDPTRTDFASGGSGVPILPDKGGEIATFPWRCT